MKNLFKLVLCGLAFVFAACGESGTETNEAPTGISYKSCEDKMSISGQAQQVTITITADAAWTASVSSTRIATISSGNSGEAGTHDIVLDFTENVSSYDRNLTLSVKVADIAKKTTICRITQASVNAKGTDATVNKTFTWPYLLENYLWNKDLEAAGNPSWNNDYDKFLDYALKSINTNMMDGYIHTTAEGEEEWRYYSYIQRLTPATQNSITRADKTYYQGFGASVYALQFEENSNDVYLVVEYVYVDSPAAKAGLKRGDIIGKINGTQITEANYWEFWYNNFLAEVLVSTNITLDVYEFDWLAWSLTSPRTVSITSAAYYENPVIYYDVFTSTANSSKKVNIAYMVYNTFDTAFDDEIKKVFDFYAEASTETGQLDYMILDLRYNGGGNVKSCCYLSSLIAGANALSGGEPKVFMYSRYNDERMIEQHRNKDDYTTYKMDLFDKDAATAYNFPFKNVYVIGTYDTASSSEMVINALKGVGENIVLVGGRTNGKNVGMEVLNTQTSGYGAIEGHHYILAPITFQSYNCNGESDFDNGFVPEDDLNCQSFFDTMLPVDWGTQLVEVENDGETFQMMADYFAVALNNILTKESPATSASVKRMPGRELTIKKGVTRLAGPSKKQDVFRNNAWVWAEEK